jgi:hypothetical protein
MKKITLLIALLISCGLAAQTWTTGTVDLDPGDNFTVKFDVNTSTNLVTMTMVGNQNVWLAVAPGVNTGNGMGNAGDDVVVYNSAGLQDRNMTGSTGTPGNDAVNNWNLISDTASGGLVTVVATRAINTGNSDDFVFPTSAQALPIMWAHGNGTTSFGYHGAANKGGVTANITLSTNSFDLKTGLSFYPNPAKEELNISLSILNQRNLEIEIFNVLGKRVLKQKINQNKTKLNIQNMISGVYLVRLTSKNTGEFVTKKFIKL